MTLLQTGGLELDVPRGWDARSTPRPLDEEAAAARVPGSPPPPETIQLHAATFALPEQRGDFGSGAVEIMQTRDLFLALIEYAPGEGVPALFAAEGFPGPLSPNDFDPDALQRPIGNQAGVQRFFHIGPRRFCLYVALGHRVLAARQIGAANALVSSMRLR